MAKEVEKELIKVKQKLKLVKAILAVLQRMLALLKGKRVKRIPVKALAEAMSEFEGWGILNSLPRRFNNPCALRYSKFQVSSKNNFAVFAHAAEGWKACVYDLSCKCLGKTRTGLNGNSNILELIRVWAPASDNNKPLQYAAFVANKLGVPLTYQLKHFIL